MSLSSTFPDPSSAISRTRIIAHRGACGYLPEHTAVAKVLAYGFGVDFIEQDVVATRDHDLVVLHDVVLDDVSDVAMRFPKRRHDDGHFYVADFTTAELHELTLSERRQPGDEQLRYPQRFPYSLPDFRVMRFEDEVRLIGGLNATTGRQVGIYPEIKEPAWHADRGIDLTQLVHSALVNLSGDISGPLFVQSFDREALQRLRGAFNVSWPLIQLLDGTDTERLAGNAAAAEEIAAFAVGVGLPYGDLLEPDGNGIRATALASTLADAGLIAHPYTLRREAESLAKGVGYFDALKFLIRDLQVDALFCDQPDDALAVRYGSRV
jgi:glycerophosphoryl diester phosphodiesterase